MELLNITYVDRLLVTPHYMSFYKLILKSSNGHLSDSEPSEHIKTIRVS
jgi:hypothetical protein